MLFEDFDFDFSSYLAVIYFEVIFPIWIEWYKDEQLYAEVICVVDIMYSEICK